jgi:hypothetical protein
MSALPHIDEDTAEKIAAMIRLVLSNQSGEADNSWKALGRVLQKGGKDLIDAVAGRVEFGEKQLQAEIAEHAKLDQNEMQAIFNAGVEEGRRQAGQAGHQSNGHGAPRSGSQFPSAYDMAMFCHARLGDLDEWYQEFIPSIITKRLRKGIALSPPQQSKLEEAYLQLGGKLT